jgi:hypothetical protein
VFSWEHLRVELGALFTETFFSGRVYILDLNVIDLGPLRALSVEMPFKPVIVFAVD